MKRGSQNRNRSLNLLIAFVIIWVSFASIIDFHIHKIHGKDIVHDIVFIKTEKKKQIQYHTTFKIKPDFNVSFVIFQANDIVKSIFSIIVFQNSIGHTHLACIQNPLLRGPPFL